MVSLLHEFISVNVNVYGSFVCWGSKSQSHAQVCLLGEKEYALLVYIMVFIMAKWLNVVVWNVRGMGDASKRYAIFSWLRQFQPAILCLSETHLTRSWIGHSFHSTYSSHSRGVSVLIHRSI